MRIKSLLLLYLLLLAGCGEILNIGGTRETYRINTPRAAGVSEQDEKTILARMDDVRGQMYTYVDKSMPDIMQKSLADIPYSMEQLRTIDREYLPAVVGQAAAAACVAHTVWPQQSAKAFLDTMILDRTAVSKARHNARINYYTETGSSAVNNLSRIVQVVQEIPCEKLGDMDVKSLDEVMQSQYDPLNKIVLRSHDVSSWRLYEEDVRKVVKIADHWQDVWSLGSPHPKAETPEKHWAELWTREYDPDNDVAEIILHLRKGE